MGHDVVVGIPVSPEAADLLQDGVRAKVVGELVSKLLLTAREGADPLAAAISAVKAQARADGLTDADIDAELAAYNAERRL